MNRTYVPFEPLMLEETPYVFYNITWNVDYLELPNSEAARRDLDAIHQDVRRNRWILDVERQHDA